ncbi:DgyrCDS10953 [Dimorphilus gyrociliatus]|uniref:DgyrCDS10953 n=1 Tax=Dimorphilus gyrociliatus TaxID=2664684 RepID=A0A7I8W1Z3_9ANNE|nr:DgyrCDS10953 [Dimorphilus gyrociliatus]
MSRSPLTDRTNYDFVLKFLLVGDGDVGKEEMLDNFENGASDLPFGFPSANGTGKIYKTKTILLDGRRVKLQLWDASGQGRFCTILRTYSRGVQGIILVYDITSRWSFDGIDRWLKEVDQLAPGVPRILVGNRLHLAFRRQVSELCAESYALKNNMSFFEVSSLCDYNLTESLAELARLSIKKNGIESSWSHNKVVSLQEMCCRTIVSHTTIYGIDHLPLPLPIKTHLKSFLMANNTRSINRRKGWTNDSKSRSLRKRMPLNPSYSPATNCRKSCCIS